MSGFDESRFGNFEFDDLGDFPSFEFDKYFDFDNNRPFDEDARALIDRIANDPRYTWGMGGRTVAGEYTAHLDDDRRRSVEHAARLVFDERIGDALRSEAEEIVARALKDPAFDALAPFNSEDPAEDYFHGALADADPRLREMIDFVLPAADGYERRQQLARRQVEDRAEQIFEQLDQATKDRLVFVTRSAHREDLLASAIGPVSSRRRGWTAYLVHRYVKEREAESVLDRYSTAAKILAANGLAKSVIARKLEVSPSRAQSLLERETSADLKIGDPLLRRAPELTPVPGAPRPQLKPHPASDKPKSFSSMTVGDKERLAAETGDPAMLMRLAKQGSRRISEALLERHVRSGDVPDDVLLAILNRYPPRLWLVDEFSEANQQRPLPPRTGLAVAGANPVALLDSDDATAAKLAGSADERITTVLALRGRDVGELKRVLGLDELTPAFKLLLELLVGSALPESLLTSPDFIQALLDTSERVSDPDTSALLRLVACQDPAVLAEHVQAAETTGAVHMEPSSLVKAALGPYHRGGEGIDGVRSSAMTLWNSANLTVEQSLARAVTADRGQHEAVFQTKGNLFVATAEALRSYQKSESVTYAYVHPHLSAATDHHFGDIVFRGPTSLPALNYHRESGKHPRRPQSEDVQVIVWPFPLQPAIYSVEESLGATARFIAVCDGKVALLKQLDLD